MEGGAAAGKKESMIPVTQTTFGADGNCLCACLASILHTDIDLIPNPKRDFWQDEMNEYLVNNHGVFMMTVHIAGGDIPLHFSESYTIGCGKSNSGLLHAVVCRDGKIVHDPLPGSGLEYSDIDRFDLLIKYFN